MAGRLGNVNKTIQNLKILKIIKESNILIVKGAVPGPKGGILKIVDSLKIKNNNIPSVNTKQETSSKIKDVNEKQFNEVNTVPSKLQANQGASDNDKKN